MWEQAAKNAFVILKKTTKDFRFFLDNRSSEALRDVEETMNNYRFLVNLLACGMLVEAKTTCPKLMVFLKELFPCPDFEPFFGADKEKIEEAGKIWLEQRGVPFFKDILTEEKPIPIKPYPFGDALGKLHKGIMEGLNYAIKAFFDDHEGPYFPFMHQFQNYFRPPYMKAVEEIIG